jgi:two-component system chemotaxis response regulator CheB
MPASALEMGPVDFTLAVADIGPTIANLVRQKRPAMPVEQERIPGFLTESGNPLSTFTCPECHGVLWEVKGDPPQFRCRVGHSYSVSRLLELQDDGVERSLWAAIRAMEESGSLARRLAEDAERRNQAFVARHFLQRAREQERHAEVLRQLAEAAPAVKKPAKFPAEKA